MANLTSVEVKLIKSTGNGSSPVQSNPVLTFKTATRTGLFFGTTQINAKQLEKYIAHIPPSSIICTTPIFPIGRATRADGTLMPTNQFELAHPNLETEILTIFGNLICSNQRNSKGVIILSTLTLEIDNSGRRGLPANAAKGSVRIELIEAHREIEWIDGTNWQTVLLEQKEAQVTGSGEMLLRDAKNSTILTIQKETIDRNYIEGAGLSDTMLGVGKAIHDDHLPLGSFIKVDEKLEIGTCSKLNETITLTYLTRKGVHKIELLFMDSVEHNLLSGNSRGGSGLEVKIIDSLERSFIQGDTRNAQGLELKTTNGLTRAFIPHDSGGSVERSLLKSQVTHSLITSDKSSSHACELLSARITDQLVYRNTGSSVVHHMLSRLEIPASSILDPVEMPYLLSSCVQSGLIFGKVRDYGIERTVIKTAKWHPAFRLDESVFLWGTKSSISLDQRIILSQCKSFDEFINVERRYFSVIDEVIELGKTVSCEMKVELNPCRSFDETVHLKLAGSVTSDEQVNLSKNYMDSAKVDETIVILPRAWCDEVITLTATPIIIGFDEALLAEKSSLAKANEVIDLTMTYTPQGGGGPIPSYLRVALFNESITITKPVFDECITITNEHNVTLLGDVIRDSDLKAKGIIIYAGQDFVLEQ